MHRVADTILLIGGVSGTGKSTIADLVASELGVSRVMSTDLIRWALRPHLPREQFPELHHESFDVPNADGSLGPTCNLAGFSNQAELVRTSLQPIVSHAVGERWSTIIEGVHLVPGTADAVTSDDVDILEVLVVARDENQHRDNFMQRERHCPEGRRAARYLEHFELIRQLQDHLVQQARVHGTCTVDAASAPLETAAAQVLSLLSG